MRRKASGHVNTDRTGSSCYSGLQRPFPLPKPQLLRAPARSPGHPHAKSCLSILHEREPAMRPHLAVLQSLRHAEDYGRETATAACPALAQKRFFGSHGHFQATSRLETRFSANPQVRSAMLSTADRGRVREELRKCGLRSVANGCASGALHDQLSHSRNGRIIKNESNRKLHAR